MYNVNSLLQYCGYISILNNVQNISYNVNSLVLELQLCLFIITMCYRLFQFEFKIVFYVFIFYWSLHPVGISSRWLVFSVFSNRLEIKNISMSMSISTCTCMSSQICTITFRERVKSRPAYLHIVSLLIENTHTLSPCLHVSGPTRTDKVHTLLINSHLIRSHGQSIVIKMMNPINSILTDLHHVSR